MMSNIWITLFLIFEALFLIRALLVFIGKAAKDQGAPLDLSIIIPLKGWDESFPDLIRTLLNQNYPNPLQIIIVVDDDNPHKQKIPVNDKVILLNPTPAPPEWFDKNWRLLEGTKKAVYSNILFLDSDVSIDSNFLMVRTKEHHAGLSYCTPIYRTPHNAAEKFLAGFTNYYSFYFYKASTVIVNIGTAIGPSILVTAGQKIVMQALEANKGEIADDHALGHWFKINGYRVQCINEPIYVTKSNASWSEVLNQIKRWLILPRTIFHMLTLQSALFLVINTILNSVAPFLLYIGFAILIVGNPLTGFLILSAAVIYFMTEALIMVFIEHLYTQRTYSDIPWRHLLYVPLGLLSQPLLIAYSLISRKIEWRGASISTKRKQ